MSATPDQEDNLRQGVQRLTKLWEQRETLARATKGLRSELKQEEERVIQLLQQLGLDVCNLADGSGGCELVKRQRKSTIRQKDLMSLVGRMVGEDKLRQLQESLEHGRECKTTLTLKATTT